MGIKYTMRDNRKADVSIGQALWEECDVDLSCELFGVALRNPVIPASGCFGFGYDMMGYYDVNILGAIALKGTTLNPRFGNPLPRVAECTEGLINSVGLQNPGVEKVVSEEIPKTRRVYNGPLIANVSGFSIDEYVETSRKIAASPEVSIVELNISCPNVHGGGMSFGTDAKAAAEVTRAVRDSIDKPLMVKLTPNVTDPVVIAKAVVDAGADGICLINTVLGMRIDIRTGRPVVANTFGGFSGPAIFPIALRMVWQVSHAVDVPVVGCGGISRAEDVVEMLMAGASAVEVGAANLRNPYACKEIIEDLPGVLASAGHFSVRGLKI